MPVGVEVAGSFKEGGQRRPSWEDDTEIAPEVGGQYRSGAESQTHTVNIQ